MMHESRTPQIFINFMIRITNIDDLIRARNQKCKTYYILARKFR